MTTLSTLKAARAWMGEGEHRWTQHTMAREGACRSAHDLRAEIEISCACVIGALRHANGIDPFDDQTDDDAATAVATHMGFSSIGELAKWQDVASRKYPEILAALDGTIAAEENA